MRRHCPACGTGAKGYHVPDKPWTQERIDQPGGPFENDDSGWEYGCANEVCGIQPRVIGLATLKEARRQWDNLSDQYEDYFSKFYEDSMKINRDDVLAKLKRELKEIAEPAAATAIADTIDLLIATQIKAPPRGINDARDGSSAGTGRGPG